MGDLAGKHGGKITTASEFQTAFTDAYLSTDPSSAAFFGGLGFVVHTGNTTRLTCANFEMVGGGSGSGNGTMPTATGSMSMPMPSGTSTGGPPMFTGAASKVGVGVGGVIVVALFGLAL